MSVWKCVKCGDIDKRHYIEKCMRCGGKMAPDDSKALDVWESVQAEKRAKKPQLNTRKADSI